MAKIQSKEIKRIQKIYIPCRLPSRRVRSGLLRPSRCPGKQASFGLTCSGWKSGDRLSGFKILLFVAKKLGLRANFIRPNLFQYCDIIFVFY